MTLYIVSRFTYTLLYLLVVNLYSPGIMSFAELVDVIKHRYRKSGKHCTIYTIYVIIIFYLYFNIYFPGTLSFAELIDETRSQKSGDDEHSDKFGIKRRRGGMKKVCNVVLANVSICIHIKLNKIYIYNLIYIY